MMNADWQEQLSAAVDNVLQAASNVYNVFWAEYVRAEAPYGMDHDGLMIWAGIEGARRAGAEKVAADRATAAAGRRLRVQLGRAIGIEYAQAGAPYGRSVYDGLRWAQDHDYLPE